MAFALSLNGAQAGIFTSNNGLLEIGDEAFAVRFPPCCSRSLRAASHPTTVNTLQHNIRTVPFTRLSVTRLSVPFISYIQPLKHIISTLHTITRILDPIQTEDKDLTCREFVCAKSVTSAFSAGSVAALFAVDAEIVDRRKTGGLRPYNPWPCLGWFGCSCTCVWIYLFPVRVHAVWRSASSCCAPQPSLSVVCFGNSCRCRLCASRCGYPARLNRPGKPVSSSLSCVFAADRVQDRGGRAERDRSAADRSVCLPRVRAVA